MTVTGEILKITTNWGRRNLANHIEDKPRYQVCEIYDVLSDPKKYKKISLRVLTMLLDRGYSKHEAEDALQETFRRLLEGDRSIPKSSSEDGYLKHFVIHLYWIAKSILHRSFLSKKTELLSDVISKNIYFFSEITNDQIMSLFQDDSTMYLIAEFYLKETPDIETATAFRMRTKINHTTFHRRTKEIRNILKKYLTERDPFSNLEGS